MLLAVDASVGSWFRIIHVLRGWRVHLATGFDFRAGFGSIGARIRVPSPTLSLYYEGRVKGTFFPKLHVRIKDNNS